MPELMADIETAPKSNVIDPGEQMAVFDGALWFFANDGFVGKELWRWPIDSDARELFMDIRPGSGSSLGAELTASGGLLYFRADTVEQGAELWRTDGTVAGTKPVAPLPGTESRFPLDLMAYGGGLLFTAETDSEGRELWWSDGTDANTFMLADIVPGSTQSNPSSLVLHQGEVWFLAGSKEKDSIWRTDGTSAGTTLVVDTSSMAGVGLSTLVSTGTDLYLFGYSGNVTTVWTVEPALGLSPVGTFPNMWVEADKAVALDGDVYVPAGNEAIGNEVWRTDKSGGVVQVTDLPDLPGALGVVGLAAAGGKVWFSTYNEPPLQSEGWLTGPNPSSALQIYTTLLPWSGVGSPIALGDGVLVGVATPGGGHQTVRLEEGSQPVVLAEAEIGFTAAASWVDGKGPRVAFRACEPSAYADCDVWVSDGTPEGTFQLPSIDLPTMNAKPKHDAASVGAIYLRIIGGADTTSLWRSDGTPEGTYPISLPTADPADDPTSLFADDERAYVTSSGPGGHSVWTTDGTVGGTSLLLEGAELLALAPADAGTVLILDTEATGRELWVTDGTAEGTVALPELIEGPLDGLFPSLKAHAGRAYFAASEAQYDQMPLGWTDGTPEGTSVIHNVDGPFYTQVGTSAPLGQDLYFVAVAPSKGAELWKTDGTAAGTKLVMDVNPGPYDSGLVSLISHAGKLWFSAYGGPTVGADVWTSDGTAAGTTPLGVPFNQKGTGPNHLVGLGDSVYFRASSGFGTTPLWRTGDTPGDAEMILMGNSVGNALVVVGDSLYYGGSHPLFGTELWRSDGTVQRTELLADILPGSDSSAPTSLSVVGADLYFFATDLVAGKELFHLGDLPNTCEVGADIVPSGAVNAVDVQCMILSALWQLTDASALAPTCLAVAPTFADVDCDGAIAVSDVQITIALALGNPLPMALDSDGDNCVDACWQQ
jgi:ELWxxDGT repeat protein